MQDTPLLRYKNSREINLSTKTKKEKPMTKESKTWTLEEVQKANNSIFPPLRELEQHMTGWPYDGEPGTRVIQTVQVLEEEEDISQDPPNGVHKNLKTAVNDGYGIGINDPIFFGWYWKDYQKGVIQLVKWY